MKYELLSESYGVKVYARIDDDGLVRVTCTENNPDYQAYLKWLENPDAEITPPTL